MVVFLGERQRPQRRQEAEPDGVHQGPHEKEQLLRGRDASYLAPPAQSRTSGFPAYGSHLGCVTAKRSLGQG